MKKLNKKGFTIVELVIVIAVIAILAAVLIPTFTSVIKKANMSKDTQLVRNLNTALVADRTAGNAHNTMSDALAAAEGAGYNVRKINASATDNEILWDSKNDMFCYFDAEKDAISYIPDFQPEEEASDADLWVVRKTVHDRFATYYIGTATTVNALHSFEAGVGTNLTTVNYANTGAAKTVTIRTISESTALNINAPKDTVYHYGLGSIVNITAVASASYHEHGSFQKAFIGTGRIVVEEAGNIPAVEITAKPTAEAPVKIETAKNIVLSASPAVVEELGANKLTNVDLNVKSNTATVVVDEKVNTESVKVNGEAANPATLVSITKVSNEDALRTAVSKDTTAEYVMLTTDLELATELDIAASVTLDGNGFTITSTQRRTITINRSETATEKIDVVIKNLKVENNYTSNGTAMGVLTWDNLNSLTLDNVDISVESGSSYRQPLTISGNQEDKQTIVVNNCNLSSGESSGYAIISFRPMDLTVTDTEITAWSAFYFKAGSASSTAVATNCEFNTVNNNTGDSNSFGSVVFEDADIEFTAENCVFDVTTKQETQSIVVFNTEWAEGELENIVVSLKKVDINGTIANEDVAYSATNVVRIYDGTSVKNPANYLAEGSQVVKQGNLYVISAAEAD